LQDLTQFAVTPICEICLADLSVPRGCALYIPPKPALPGAECIDLHNNRNSARTCWGNIRQNTVLTKTLLQNKNRFFTGTGTQRKRCTRSRCQTDDKRDDSRRE